VDPSFLTPEGNVARRSEFGSPEEGDVLRGNLCDKERGNVHDGQGGIE
jgi:hypothetical protein